MRRTLYRFLIELTNGRFTSYLLRKFAQSRLSRAIIPSYARVFKIQQGEMEKELHEYRTLHELFTRRLKEGRRPIEQSADIIISPVDGVFADAGPITEDKVFHVKGKNYSVADMLGSQEKAGTYKGGTYVILYLSPSHYHRIHSPVSGRVLRRYTLGRKSYPVNELGLKYGKDTLSKNYRSITEVDSAGKHTAIVKVGAMFVNSIELLHRNDELQKGEEMAYFTFGSTVVLLFERGMAEVDAGLKPGQGVVVGQRLAKRL
ncbi:phosphatidylserine decarboxylase [Ectobacillus ponti]|uniref:Phosphatidylserine decarboxylase proenzyme n=1 Tax=Ectobacillus ponti TaxID=2961894 RepID=A0AA41X884_9BACI|nr:phosphatidylserine decarboxylase [Ectobacillus ponti]